MKENLGLKNEKLINDLPLLELMKSLIFLNDDIRPTWIGPGFGTTDIQEMKPYANWANQHWALYYGFIKGLTPQGTKILDLGCGVGFCTINLTETFPNADIIAYDIDREITDFAIKYNQTDKITYLTEDITKAKLPSACDYIFLVETLEHIKHKDQYVLIDECLKSLKNDGCLFICTPDEQTFVDKDRGHIGIMTAKFFSDFTDRYANNIVSIEHYDNTKLIGYYVEEYTAKTGSHFKIILKNEKRLVS